MNLLWGIIKMAVTSRKNRMMQNIIQNQERSKEKLKVKMKDKEISEEEQKERLEMLEKLGLVKKD